MPSCSTETYRSRTINSSEASTLSLQGKSGSGNPPTSKMGKRNSKQLGWCPFRKAAMPLSTLLGLFFHPNHTTSHQEPRLASIQMEILTWTTTVMTQRHRMGKMWIVKWTTVTMRTLSWRDMRDMCFWFTDGYSSEPPRVVMVAGTLERIDIWIAIGRFWSS